MNLFELSASISLDTSDYDKGIKSVDSSAQGAKESLEAIGKGATSAENNVKSLGNESSSVGKEMGSMGQEASSAADEVDDLGGEASSAGQELSSLGEEAGSAGQEESSLGQEASSAGQEMSSMGEEASSAGEEESSLGQEASAAGREMSSMGQEAASAGKEQSAMGQEASAAGRELSSMAQEASSAGKEISSMGSEASSAGSEMSSMGGEAGSAGSEVSNLGKEASSTGSELSNLGDKAEKSGSIMKSVLGGNVVTNVISSAWNTITSSIDGAISRVDTLNNYTTVMTNLGYTTEQAETSMTKLTDGIDGLPTTLDSIVSWQQTFTALNGDIDQSTDLTIALNNATLAAGQGQETANSAMQAWYNCIAQGKPTATYWQQLVNDMPAQMQELSQSILGDNATSQDLFEAWQEGTVTTEQVEAALIDLNENGYGEMASYAQQAIDANSGIETSMTNVATAVTRGVANVITAYDDWAEDGSMPTISEALATVKGWVNQAFGSVVDNMPAVLDAFGGLVDNVTSNVQPIMETLTSFISETLAPVISGIASVLKEDFGGAVSDVSENLSGSFQPILDAVSSFITDTFYPAFCTIADFIFQSVVPALSNIASVVTETLLPSITGLTGDLSDDLNPILSDVSGFINDHLVPAFQDIAQWVAEKVVPAISDLASFITENVVPVITELAGWCTDHLVPAFQNIGDFVIDTLVPALENLWNIFKTNILPVIEDVATFVTDTLVPAITDIATVVIDKVMGALESLSSLFTDTIAPAVETAFETISGFVSNVQTFFTETVPGAIDDMVSFFTELPGKISQKLDEIIENVTSWVSDFASNATDAASEFINNVINGIGDMINDVVEKVKELGRNIINGFKNFFKKGGEGDAEAEGEDVADKVGSGMENQSKLSAFTDKIKGVANTISGFFKKWFGKSGDGDAEDQGKTITDDMAGGAETESSSNVVTTKLKNVGNAISGFFKNWFGKKGDGDAEDQGSEITDDMASGAESESDSTVVTNALKNVGQKISGFFSNFFGKKGDGDAEDQGKTITDDMAGGAESESDSTVVTTKLKNVGNAISGFFKSWFGKKGDGDAEDQGAELTDSMATGADNESSSTVVTDALKGAGQKISGFFSGFFGKNGEGDMEQAGEDIVAGAAEGILESDDAQDAMEEQSNGILGKLKDIFDMHSPSKVMEGEGEMMTAGMVQGFVDLADDVTAKFQEMGDMIEDWCVDAAVIVWKCAQTMASRFVYGLSFMSDDAQTDALDPTSRTLDEWGTTVQNDMNDFATKAVDSFISSMKGFPSKVENILDDVTSALESWASTTENKATSIAENFLKNWNSGIKSMPSDTKSVLDDVTTKVTDFSSSLDKKMTSAGESAITKFTSGMKSKSDDAKSMASEISDKVLAKFDITDKMESYGTKAVTNFKSGMSGSKSDLYDKAKEIAENARDKFDIKDKMNTYGSKAVTNFRSGMSSESSDLRSKASEIVSGVSDRFDIKNSMDTLGWNAGIGFNNGLARTNNTIVSTANTLAGNVVGAFNFRLQIGSPSKVLYKTGENTGEGFANGLASTEGEIEDIVDDIIDTVEMADLQGAMDSSIEGLHGLTTMSASETTSGTDDRLDEVVDILSEYLPMLSQLKVVLDTGTLVGELAEPMDRQLGRLQDRRERMSA